MKMEAAKFDRNAVSTGLWTLRRLLAMAEDKLAEVSIDRRTRPGGDVDDAQSLLLAALDIAKRIDENVDAADDDAEEAQRPGVADG